MRNFRHWTPRYIKNRINLFIYEKSFPEHPWLTKSANQILISYLKSSDKGLEFGSGRSTVWFAKRVKELTSIEHDETWGKKVKEMLKSENLTNVKHLVHIVTDKENGAESSEYIKVIEQFEDSSLDFCLVDGIYRDYCALKAIKKIKPGGLLIIDNVNWFLPSDTFSPASRTFDEGPKGEIWMQVYNLLKEWRKIWTTSGVTDTAIFIKPAH